MEPKYIVSTYATLLLSCSKHQLTLDGLNIYDLFQQIKEATMKITKLKICNILKCKQTELNFCETIDESPLVFLVHGSQKCEVITLAIQLMCSNKYDTLPKLSEIWSEIWNGKVEIAFILTLEKRDDANVVYPEDCSRDSDYPCTSQQAKIRTEQRRKRTASARVSTFVIKACRNFQEDPLVVEYSINNGPLLQCTIFKFNQKFFSCTDIILPRLSNLVDGDCCQGRWLDLLSTDFIYKGKGEKNLIIKFCELYSNRKIFSESPLCQLTTSVLIGRYSLDQARISHLIQIFQHVRCLFEYLTFSEYTVWFLLPQLDGDVRDILDIKTNSINFDLMKTKIQLKTAQVGTVSSPKYPWTDAVGYVRELFLVSVQLAFGFNCQQNIIYLHSLHELTMHQSFEYIRSVFAYNSGGTGLWPNKNYLQRIVDACIKCNMTCIVECMVGIPFVPMNCSIINTTWDNVSSDWTILLKRCSTTKCNTNNTETKEH